MMCVKFMAFCDLRVGLPLQVHMQALVLQTCVDLCRLALTCKSVWPGLYVAIRLKLKWKPTYFSAVSAQFPDHVNVLCCRP